MSMKAEDNEVSADSYQPAKYDDPSAKFWSAYLSKAQKYDKALAQNWKGDMDSILIFAGLFSASVTAFIIESYKNLTPDPNVTSVALLSQISQQLSGISNSSAVLQNNLPCGSQAEFTPSIPALVCNILWFLSLSFSLACALSATLVEQWTRSFLHATDKRAGSQDRARINAYLFQGLEKFGMPTVVEAIPTLLHISLFLFFAGLVFFLLPLNAALGYLVLAVMVICCALYLLITLLPIIYHDCPYRTPISSTWWRILQIFGLLKHEDPDGIVQPLTCSMSEARELEATEITEQRDNRDFKVMSWTIKTIREDSEFEAFVEIIPNIVAGLDYSSKLLLHRLLHHEDIIIKLGYRIPQLLATCNSGVLESRISQKRAITCITAMWSLTMMSMPSDNKPIVYSPRSSLRFTEDTLELLNGVQRDLSSMHDYVASTTAVIGRGLLDMHVNRIVGFQDQLSALVDSAARDAKSDMTYDWKSQELHRQQHIINGLYRQSSLLERYLAAHQKLNTAMPYVMMEAISQHHSRLFSIISSQNPVELDLLQSTVESLDTFKIILNNAGFSLTLDYIADILSSTSLPYEPFNTIRRVFFRIDFTLPVDPANQHRFVAYLDKAFELGLSEPHKLLLNIVDILLDMTRALTDIACLRNTKAIISKYSRLFSRDTAAKALSRIDAILEFEEPSYPPPLDIFTMHLYADTRIDK
ncbi:hypothetical protein BDQ12DRAFT_719952 [Crucibulum laeve]|uniref:DUF6535 domain-containing protein n=1 Tax=Crucibulum laeve TaxID=68775 RepID=A0A5C3M954_9AGAR|nr:hypothetical protein BDQ12DRAFT_719952 [Crucibulum laeve]